MDEELKLLLEENKKISEETLAVSKEIREMTKYVKSYIIWSQIFGVIKILIILIPLVLGFIYLPPLIKSMYGQYMDLLDNPLGGVKPGLNLESLPPAVQNYLK